MKWSLALLGIIALGASFEKQAAAESNNVFGSDNREWILSTMYPWSAIGRLSTGCTGTLIGKQLVLTASHCVFEKGSVIPGTMTFYPNTIRGKAATSADVDYIWYGSTLPQDNRGDDWAVLHINKNLGDTYGTMGVSSKGAAYGDVVSLAGYSADKDKGNTGTVHRNCYIQSADNKEAYHDCDNTRGSSGGPVFVMNGDVATIVGLNVSEYRDGGEKSLFLKSYSRKRANVAVNTKYIYEDIAAIYANPNPPVKKTSVDCSYYSNQVLALVMDDSYQTWEINYAKRYCSEYAVAAFKLIRDDDYQDWEMLWASQINSSFALEALKQIRDTSYEQWEMQYAAQVNSYYALEAVKEIRDTSYEQWEMQYAVQVNNQYALAAFKDITDDSYQEWELKWIVYVNSQRELDLYNRLRQYQNYYENDLRAVVLVD